MSNVFNKLKDFVGFNEPVDLEDDDLGYDEDDAYPAEEPTVPVATERPNRRAVSQSSNRFAASSRETTSSTSKSNVIGMPGTNNNGLNEIVVIEPQSFEKMPEVIQALRERKTVLLNLNMMEPDEAQRAVDFVAGGTYAIDGNQERVGESIFLFTPNCVNVTSRSHSTPSATQTAASGQVQQMATATANWHKPEDSIAQ
ncbi:cell division protein SepF [Euhalothece natronophila Z-M001]|uniref:Cell division protein SepF n=1 Tax=Euhalothece natronophila Z-M001 TaxID=522448 RepID=A0A5B8NRD9_9CHRO|nr:cell division protein SepF [Euhalothece natronophila]QDZ40640.1 cell division protein SepF [Euhalothece natronophila Z-M001]